uniref:Sulfate ABC transporter protein n=1 Tax=Cyanidium sp. THAL103 TaxID=3027999 RepID=A0A9Y1I425_9RHOD|nr:sulfate ABC transporter protein [Cyanidium sp. THAL103]
MSIFLIMRILGISIHQKLNHKILLDNCSISIKQGEITGLLGPNGAGKTSLFSIFSGVLPSFSGNIFYSTKNINTYQIEQRSQMGIKYVPQDNNLLLDLTVYSNLASILEVFYLSSCQINNKISLLLDLLNISHLSQYKCKMLSGGEKKKVELAKIFLCQPNFILLDEPFSGIDPISIFEIQEFLLKMKSWNIGVLISDHNVNETLKIIDRGYVIYKGCLLAHGTPLDLHTNYEVRNYYLGNQNKIEDAIF